VSRHHLALSQHVLIGMALLFVTITLLFAMDLRVTGRATNSQSTVFILNSTPRSCNFDVQEGYNIISMACLTTAAPVYSITNSTQVWAMYQYAPGSSDLWRVYNPNLPSYVVSDLGFMTRRVGYIVIMNSSANVTVDGIQVASTDVGLAAGWNLVGYPAFVTRNMSDGLGAINGSITKVMTFNTSTQNFVSYPGDLQFLTPGEGYWVNSTNATTWTVLK
jgi:hypothetical protein